MKKLDWMFDEKWIFDQSQNSGLDFSDPLQVAQYDRKANVTVESINALLDTFGVSASDTLIDFGAGTGAFALEAAKRCKRVIAVDISSTMLAYLAEKAREQNLNNIECVSQGFLSYEHRGDPVEYIYTRNALHHLPDFWKVQALVRLHHTLKSGGVLALHDLIFSFEPKDAPTFIEAWLSAAPTDHCTGWTRPELATHLREEYSTYGWLLEAMLERVGFRIHAVNYSNSKFFADYVCVKI